MFQTFEQWLQKKRGRAGKIGVLQLRAWKRFYPWPGFSLQNAFVTTKLNLNGQQNKKTLVAGSICQSNSQNRQ